MNEYFVHVYYKDDQYEVFEVEIPYDDAEWFAEELQEQMEDENPLLRIKGKYITYLFRKDLIELIKIQKA